MLYSVLTGPFVCFVLILLAQISGEHLQVKWSSDHERTEIMSETHKIYDYTLIENNQNDVFEMGNW